MSADVVLIRPNLDVPATLRRIADQIEAGEFTGQSATLVLDNTIFHFGITGVHDDIASREAVWQLTYAIHRLMGVVT